MNEEAELTQMIFEADQALYESKRQGKNRFTHYKELPVLDHKKNA